MSSAMMRAARCLLALSLCAAGAGCAGTSQGDTVTVLVPWTPGTAEYHAFVKVTEPFEENDHVHVVVQSSQAPTLQLDADQAAGNLPDIVDLPSPGAVYEYKEQGLLKPLHVGLGSYDQPWRSLAELGTGTVYAVPVKADVKSLIWYRKGVLLAPASWAALENLSLHGTPWCVGLASGSASGWPGADWVAEILLSRYQAGTYENWLAGQLPWTSREVLTAWTAWGRLMRYGAAINGKVPGALKTTFGTGASALPSGQCELEFGALAATGLTTTTGYSYVRFPSISASASPILVSGDFMGLFTSNMNARSLLAYLASGPAQTLWVKQSGHAFSADQAVKPDAYPPGAEQTIAKLFQPADDGTMLCFSAEDMMLPDMSTAFENAVLYYLNNHALLRALMDGMQKTQQRVKGSPVAKRACAKP
jgi:alpha-glucoside transport system substrate-binding protein